MNDCDLKMYAIRQTDFITMLEGELGSDTVISFPPIRSANDDWVIHIRWKVTGRTTKCRLSSETMTGHQMNYERVFAKRISRIKKLLS
jgi:hypothetical protein